MPRVVYAMAKDGLVFRELAQISPLTNTPLKATLMLGAFTAFISFIMSLEVLVEMMSIGTLMAYTLVCRHRSEHWLDPSSDGAGVHMRPSLAVSAVADQLS